jgi:hypothetical protein
VLRGNRCDGFGLGDIAAAFERIAIVPLRNPVFVQGKGARIDTDLQSGRPSAPMTVCSNFRALISLCSPARAAASRSSLANQNNEARERNV